MRIPGFGKKDTIDDMFGERTKEKDNMVRNIENKNLGKDLNETHNDIETVDDDYIDPDDLEYCEYGDIVDIIEENGWSHMSSAGLCHITHFDTDIVHTKPCKENGYEDILEITCPPGNIIAICGFNQEDIDKDDFFNSPNLYTRPHSFALRLADSSNSIIPPTTIIGMSLITRNGDIKKLYEEFYGDLCPTIDGKLKKKEERYYFAETIVLQSGEKLILHAYWPSKEITKIELLMMADIFVKDQ